MNAELAALGLCLDIALFVHLYLADMAHFAAANAAYCRHLPAVSPSAGACVQAQLLPGCPVMIEVLLPSSVQGASLITTPPPPPPLPAESSACQSAGHPSVLLAQCISHACTLWDMNCRGLLLCVWVCSHQ